MTTKNAVAGEFVSRGDDFIHYKNEKGELMHSVDVTGVLYPQGIKFPDGSYQASAASSTETNIDSGTF